MNSSLVRQTNRRPFHRSWATALSLVTVLVLAACGTTDVALPVVDDEEEAPTTISQPSFAVFVADAHTFATNGTFEVGFDADASSGAFLVQPETIATSSSGDPELDISFELESGGEHTLWARVRAESLNGDATYLGFDGATRRVFAPELGRYVWLEVVRENLVRGPHVLSIGFGEAGLRIDLLVVTSAEDVTVAELEELVVDEALPSDPSTPETSDPEPSDPEPSDPEPTDPEPTDPEPTDPKPTNPEPSPAGAYSLRGNPSFSPASLSSDTRLWYDRSLSSVRGSVSGMASRARRDDVYYHGRDLYQFSTATLLALRSTGDLRFLDELDTVLQTIRGTLRDGWDSDVESTVYVNSKYGTVSEPDGHRNFSLQYESGAHHGRDTGDLNETLAHGHLAMIMYAYHVNRDLVSPAGINYGERADFWFEYLRNDFEAKWRERSDVAWPAMDFIDLKFSHTYSVFTLYYYFMGKRLESEGDPDAAPYLAKVADLTDAYFDEQFVAGGRTGGFVHASAPTGDAVVYRFGAPGRSNVPTVSLEASPMTYSRYLMSAFLVLHLEGVARWDDAIMMRLANGLTGFVIDVEHATRSSDTIAAGVTGSATVAGIDPTTYRGRLTVGKFAITNMPAYAVWDASRRLETFSLEVYDAVESDLSRPSSAFIPANMLFIETATTRYLGFTASR